MEDVNKKAVPTPKLSHEKMLRDSEATLKTLEEIKETPEFKQAEEAKNTYIQMYYPPTQPASSENLQLY